MEAMVRTEANCVSVLYVKEAEQIQWCVVPSSSSSFLNPKPFLFVLFSYFLFLLFSVSAAKPRINKSGAEWEWRENRGANGKIHTYIYIYIEREREGNQEYIIWEIMQTNRSIRPSRMSSSLMQSTPGSSRSMMSMMMTMKGSGGVGGGSGSAGGEYNCTGELLQSTYYITNKLNIICCFINVNLLLDMPFSLSIHICLCVREFKVVVVLEVITL